MKTKREIKLKGSETELRSFKSDIRHGYNGLVDKWGAMRNNTLLGYKFLMLANYDPSATHDHMIGTNLVLDKMPDNDLVLTVNGISKKLYEMYWKKTPVTANGSPVEECFIYNDGNMNHDHFELAGLHKGDVVRVSLQVETPVNSVLWDDTMNWSDSKLWVETVEMVDATWDDALYWDDDAVWKDTALVPALQAELNEWLKLASKINSNTTKYN